MGGKGFAFVPEERPGVYIADGQWRQCSVASPWIQFQRGYRPRQQGQRAAW